MLVLSSDLLGCQYGVASGSQNWQGDSATVLVPAEKNVPSFLASIHSQSNEKSSK